MNRNYSVQFLAQFFGVSLLLRKTLVHDSFFNFREDFEEIICKLFLLPNPSVVHYFLLRDVSEGFHYTVLQEGLGLAELVVVISQVDGEESIFFQQLLIGLGFSIAQNQGDKLLCVFFRVLKDFPYLLGHPNLRLLIITPLNIDVSPDGGYEVLLEVVKRTSLHLGTNS